MTCTRSPILAKLVFLALLIEHKLGFLALELIFNCTKYKLKIEKGCQESKKVKTKRQNEAKKPPPEEKAKLGW